LITDFHAKVFACKKNFCLELISAPNFFVQKKLLPGTDKTHWSEVRWLFYVQSSMNSNGCRGNPLWLPFRASCFSRKTETSKTKVALILGLGRRKKFAFQFPNPFGQLKYQYNEDLILSFCQKLSSYQNLRFR